jgi:uncharacterized protein (DUF983 family)
MEEAAKASSSNYIFSILQLKCPRCRQGHMFLQKSSYRKKMMKMHDNCPVCGQRMEIEPSFYYGTGYVSYALSVALSVASLVAWWVIIGMSLSDNRFFWWISFNAVLLLAAQPYIMRLSRTVWLSFFVRYDKKAIMNHQNVTHESGSKLIK